MNAAQRRTSRRAHPESETCGLQGYSGTTSYPDLMCMDGVMRDMDVDGWDPSTWAPPCKNCNPIAHREWIDEQMEEDEEQQP